MIIYRYLLTIVVALFTIGLFACSHSASTTDGASKAAIPANSPDQAVELERRDQLSKTEQAEYRRIHLERQRSARIKQANESSTVMHDADTGRHTRQHYVTAPPVQAVIRPPSEPLDRENYAHYDDNPIKRVAEHPVSTFSIDVDSGSYANVRRLLNAGQIPRQDAVRTEELINYFDYAWEGPAGRNVPFAVHTELAANPWNQNSELLLVGIQGYDVPKQDIPASNLVFLIDVSGSMHSPDKLPLLRSAMKLLTTQLDAKDRVAIVVYAGASGIVLEPTKGNQRARINAAIDALQAGGSTNGAAGIRAAYALAQQGWIDDGINRIILATDGDFNVGTTHFEALKDLVEEKRKSGISLTTLGFGTGNYNDQLMEQLADVGNGNYGYIDSLNEAHKLLVEERSGTLLTIAKDVKIQIEFNPAQVSEYRLIGYENRQLEREDFNNDKIDAGEIGAGHSVTALYEISRSGSQGQRNDPLRYGSDKHSQSRRSSELAFLRLRYKAPDADRSRLIEQPIMRPKQLQELDRASTNLRFATAVAGFGQLLRGGKYTEQFNFNAVTSLARSARGEDPYGHRGEFLKLVQLANSLTTPEQLGMK